MTPRHTVEGRLASALLRHHRETSRLTVEEAADALGCDKSKISRMENGLRRVRPRELLSLLAAYRVTGQEREAVAALGQAVRSGWWDEYRGLLPDAMVDRAVLESAAGEVMVYAPQVLPALLQTCRYAEAAAAGDPVLGTEEERGLAVSLAAGRAGVLRDKPPGACTVVLGEAALRQRVGGSEAMLALLRRLAGEEEGFPAPFPLRVVPFAAGAHPGFGTGPLSVMRFAGVSGIGAVGRGQGDQVLVVGQGELTAAVRRFDAIRDAALSPGLSLQLIRTTMRKWR